MAIFGPLLALDPTQPGTVAKSAAGKAYAVDDDALATPLPMTDLAGVTITDALSDANGIIQAFQVEDHDEVVWVSGDYRVPCRAFGAVLDRAEAAASAANDANQTVQALVPAVNANRVPPGGLSGQVLAKASNADNDVTWINPPAGGGGSGAGVLVLGDSDPIPVGTPALTPIFRLSGALPTPVDVRMKSGTGAVSSATAVTGTEAPNLTITITPPTAADVGDLLVAVVAAQSPSDPFEWTVPGGWTNQFESDEGRHLLVATYPIGSSGDLDDISDVPQQFQVVGHTGSTRVVAMMLLVTGADLDEPIVGVSPWDEGTTTAKTYGAFSASAPAGGQLVVGTGNLSSGAPEPSVGFAPGYQGIASWGVEDPNSGGRTYVWASHYQVSGLSMPERSESYTPAWSANVWGVHLAIAGA